MDEEEVVQEDADVEPPPPTKQEPQERRSGQGPVVRNDIPDELYAQGLIVDEYAGVPHKGVGFGNHHLV